MISNDSPADKRWLAMWSEKEQAMRVRMGDMVDKIDAKAHDLAPLEGSRTRRVPTRPAGTAQGS